MASGRLCSRSPFSVSKEDKSVLSDSTRIPGRTAGPLRAARGELWALGVLRLIGVEGCEGLDVGWCHMGGDVQLRR